MISEKLQKAREFEQEQLSKISPEERPSFHVTGGTGWINDPNGFSYYNGEYHLFYQYHPYSNEWGPMHWGHLSSKDMLAWKRLPVVMAPEESYDNFGCFSGSALELSDGRHLLMYTGVGYVGDTPMANGELPTHQTQCMAVGDGVNYEKYENNPVITGDDIPEGGSKVDFRDPKIWKEDDGYFYAVISNMTDDGNSRILLYRSPDGFKWEYVTVLDHSDAKLGKMWECPDFFDMDGQQVMLVSPQEMQATPDGVFHAGLFGELRPLFRVVIHGIKFVEIGLIGFHGDTLLAAHPFAARRNGVQPPMDEHAETILPEPGNAPVVFFPIELEHNGHPFFVYAVSLLYHTVYPAASLLY